MSNLLKQSTAVDVGLGPFLDDTDGKTAETALTITQPDIRLKKNGGAWAQKNAAQTLTHEENGWYEVALDSTDTNTVGCLIVAVHESGVLPVWRELEVLPAAVYDALTSTARFGVDYSNIALHAAGPFAASGIIDSGTAQSATGTTLVLRAAAAFANSEIVGAIVVIRSATTGAGQARMITGYVGATDTATVDAWTTTPTGTIVYDIFGNAPASASAPPAVNVTQANGAALLSTAGLLHTDVKKINATTLTGDGDVTPWGPV